MVQPPVIAVVGPTGSGKSDLAVNLALELDGEVINADALQFYRGMDIGTAKITPAECKGVPHHLLDILDVTEEASVSDFQQQARSIVSDIHARGKRVILAGGSGLYVRPPSTSSNSPARIQSSGSGSRLSSLKPARMPSWRGSGRWIRCQRAVSPMRAGSSGRSKSISSPAGPSVPLCPAGVFPACRPDRPGRGPRPPP
ncbi:tRNA dimethylallyltransferase [Arthrobacter sp. Hiyo4]|nr:tRNA dimethylallyltransferase [Arthrobacter sp. Hiyo4]